MKNDPNVSPQQSGGAPLLVDNSEYDRRVRDYHLEWAEISASFEIPNAMAHDSGLELIEAE